MQEIIISPIARIRSDFPTKFGIPRQSGLVQELRATVVFEPEYRNPDALRQNGDVVGTYQCGDR
jgi:tRNA (Thr-GGU) A37 N-methylase